MPVFHFTLKQNNGIFSFQQTSILGPFNFYPQDLIMLEIFYEQEAQELHLLGPAFISKQKNE
jgi:hypothetical protein